jgi:4-hydroxy-3-methylbut-2-enyl diphosphate reductase
LVLVVGSTTSSNSNRLREVAEAQGTPAYLLLEPDEVRPEWVRAGAGDWRHQRRVHS